MESRSKQPSPDLLGLHAIKAALPGTWTKQRNVVPANVDFPVDSVQFDDVSTSKHPNEIGAENVQTIFGFQGHVQNLNAVGALVNPHVSEELSNLSALAEPSELTFGVFNSVCQLHGQGINDGTELPFLQNSEVTHFVQHGKQ